MMSRFYKCDKKSKIINEFIMQTRTLRRIFSSTTLSRRKNMIKVNEHVPKNEGRDNNSLQYRFIKYLEKSIDLEKEAEHLTEYRVCPRKSAEKIGTSNLTSIINSLQNLKNVKNTFETQSRLRIIDARSRTLLPLLSFDDNLLLLNKLLEIVPYRLLKLNIYNESIDRCRYLLPEESIASYKIVNLLFLASLSSSGGSNVKLFMKYLPTMKNLPLIEQCIVSIATFKTGVKLSRENIQAIEDSVYDNLDTLFNEPSLFVSLLKALRYNGPSPEFSLSPISKKLLTNDENYPMSLAVPVLALYAEMLRKERNVVKKLMTNSISDLSSSLKSVKINSKSSTSIRPKDVSRFLWAISRLNCRLTKHQTITVQKYIDMNLEVISNNPDMYNRIVLFLWMIGSPRPRERVDYGFREKIFDKLIDANDECQARLHLLLDCIRIEASDIMIPNRFNDINREQEPLKFYEVLEDFSELMKCSASHFGLENIKIDCPVTSIRMYGISMKHETLGWIHGDILNSVTCLRGTSKPNGLMALKCRLIKRLGYTSILFREEKVERMVEKVEEMINSRSKI